MVTGDDTSDVTAPTTTGGRRRMVAGIWKPLGVLAVVLIALNLFGFNPIGRIRESLFGASPRPAAAGATLLTLQRTAQLRAATGSFSVPVYFGTAQDGLVHEVLPDALDGNSGVAIYQGSVDALVDLKGLTADDLAINRTDRSIVITVPRPGLTDPNIDEKKSKVITQSRGVLTRLGELLDDAPLQGRDQLDEAAVKALTKAARESDLQNIAEDNTSDFLTALAKRLGYEQVEIKFEDASAP